MAGVVLYDVFASGNTQPWDPSQARQAAFLVNQDAAERLPRIPQGREDDPLLARPMIDDRADWERSLDDSLTLG